MSVLTGENENPSQCRRAAQEDRDCSAFGLHEPGLNSRLATEKAYACIFILLGTCSWVVRRTTHQSAMITTVIRNEDLSSSENM